MRKFMKGNRIRTYVSTIAITALAALCLTACSGSFDASRYTKACLDATTKADFSDYIDMTRSSQSTAEAQYKEVIRSYVTASSSQLLPDVSTKDALTSAYQAIFKNCKYEVGEATSNGDSTYTVPVTVYKQKVFAGVIAETTEKTVEAMKSSSSSSKSEMNKAYAKSLAEVLTEHSQNPEYGDAVTVSITVKPTAADKNVYELDETEQNTLFAALMDFEALSESDTSQSK